MNSITALLTEWGKFLTQVLLLVLVVQQYFAKRAADKRGQAVQVSAGRAEAAATTAAEKVVEVADKTAQVAERAEHIAEKTESVRQALVDADSATTIKLDRLAVSNDKIHTLVNSNMGVQLRISAGALRRVAEYSKDPADDRIATEAERLAADHESKQQKVDIKAGL